MDATQPEDSRIDLIRELARRAEAADGAAPFDEAVLLSLARDGLPADDARVEVRDDAAGWLDVRAGATDLHLVVDPEQRGQGCGAALAALLLDGTSGPVRAWSHGDHPAARALAATHGFDRARALWVMRRPADLPLPDLAGRDGVRLRHLGSDGDREADRDALIALNAAAFADHPEQGALDVDGFEQRAAESWFDAEGVLLAVDDASGELLGFHWTKIHPQHDQADQDDAAGQPEGEIYVLGVAPGAQGRGVGSLLSLAGLHHLRSRGAGDTLLYVEDDNAAAVRTYEKLGFTHAGVDTHVQYAR